jgi:hypothetical protein
MVSGSGIDAAADGQHKSEGRGLGQPLRRSSRFKNVRLGRRRHLVRRMVGEGHLNRRIVGLTSLEETNVIMRLSFVPGLFVFLLGSLARAEAAPAQMRAILMTAEVLKRWS